MKLRDYLNGNTVRLDLASQTRNEAVTELADVLRHHPSMVDFEEFLGAVFSREKESTTGIGDRVALPHARTDSVKDLVVAVGRSSKGIDFKSIDGKPVRLVFLMGIPTNKVKTYLKLLAHLSLLIKQDKFVDKLLAAPDAASVLELVAQYEE